MKRLTHIDYIGWYIEDQSIAFDERRRGLDVDRLAAYEDAMPIERAQELAQAEKDGRLVVLQDGITVHDLQNEYCTARHMADERLPSPSYTTGHIAGFGEGAIHILNKILTREEAESALKKREEDA